MKIPETIFLKLITILICFVKLSCHQVACPVRIVSHRLITSGQYQTGNGNIHSMSGIWRHFSTDKSTIHKQISAALGNEMIESSVQMPGPNNSAIIYSEHYEPDSENNFKCQFIFIGAPDERVQIIFHWFHLRLMPTLTISSRIKLNQTSILGRCEESDHLIAHVLLNERMSKIVEFCGDELPAQLMSANNVLTLTYVLKSAFMGRDVKHFFDKERNENNEEKEESVDDKQHYGWIAEYRFITDYGNQPSILNGNDSCSFLFDGNINRTGNVWSPNYPGFYPRNVDCQYVFLGAKDQIVFVTFEYFDVEGHGQCDDRARSDFVLFSNYRTRDRTNRRFCGALKPKDTIKSESNYFRMIFHSNDIFDGTGFYARYQFFDQGSTRKLPKLMNTISSSSKLRISMLTTLIMFIFRISLIINNQI
ncbi:hypothetical protein ACQ4LE_007444 [Meloidogyne hapla]